ncbi:NfeD family protein [Sphingomonas sp. 1P06PA]|uniref:NfeD family protein n=1 Tax=Sphingomonas sp. 1P06PA TaxID=554121 RepID=UPI0039A415D2
MIDGSLPIAAHWLWLILALALGIAEMVVPGVFLIWLAVAAAVTGLAALAIGIAAPLQFGLFALTGIAAVYAGRRWFAANPIRSEDPLLNERTIRLLGERVVVTAAIAGGQGRVRLGDSEWTAEGPDAPIGTRMVIAGVRGNALHVVPDADLI